MIPILDLQYTRGVELNPADNPWLHRRSDLARETQKGGRNHESKKVEEKHRLPHGNAAALHSLYDLLEQGRAGWGLQIDFFKPGENLYKEC